MDNLSLKTKISYESDFSFGFDYKTKAYNILQLKDESIILYSNDEISFFNKSFKSSVLTPFPSEENDKESTIITSVKQIRNGKILCCFHDLYVLSIKSKKLICSKKIKIPNNEIIFDIIELKNEKILGLTNKSIYKITIKEKNNFEFSQIYKIPEDWLITPFSKKRIFFSSFKQYMNTYELPNDRLLIHSYSTEFSHNGGCGTHPPSEISVNKIYILNLKNFEIVHQFKEIHSEINLVILNKYICICYFYGQHMHNIIDIYNLNDYKLIKIIEDKFPKKYIIKYDENTFIGMNEKEEMNDIIVYSLSDINDIKYKKFKGEFIKFETKYYNFCYEVRNTKNKSVYILKNGSIFIISHGLIFIVNFPLALDIKTFNPLSQIEYKPKDFDYLKRIKIVYLDDY